MLVQFRTTTCSRNQPITGGKEGVLVYIRMSVSLDQSVGGFGESKLFWPRTEGQIAVMSLLQLVHDLTLFLISYVSCWLGPSPS